MAGYAISRERTMQGLGTTFAFRPRLRGVGQDLTPPDIFAAAPAGMTPPIVEAPGGPSVPPGFYSGAAAGPSFVPTVYGPLAPAPTITAQAPTAPPALTVVFPSQGSTALTAASLAPPSWFQGSTSIAGLSIPNIGLALGVVAIVLVAGAGASKRRR